MSPFETLWLVWPYLGVITELAVELANLLTAAGLVILIIHDLCFADFV